MTGAVDNLRNITGGEPFKRVDLFEVVGLAADPTVVIVDDGDGTGLHTMRCLDGYRNRTTGDQVLAVQLGGGDWVVLGKIGADETLLVGMQQGIGDPSGGTWREASAVWVYDHMDGRRELHLDVTGAAPTPVIVEATDAITWNGSDPTRETLDVDGTRIAAWYYSGGIAAACVAKTATAMFLRVTRSEEGGPDGAVPLRLGMHGGLIAAPLATNFWEPGVLLARGETVLVPIPALYLSVLDDGTVGGFVAYAETSDHAMRLEPEADLHIHFG